MNARAAWKWLLIAAALLLGILGWERFGRRLPAGPELVLPGFRPDAVKAFQLQLAGQSELRVERTNGAWRLTQPVAGAAQTARVNALLDYFTTALPVLRFTAQELHARPDADKEFGFDRPRATLLLESSAGRQQVLIGTNSPAGDVVYLQVVGTEGALAVSAALLRLLPGTTDDWRDPTLLDWHALDFDGVAVSNGGRTLALQREATNRVWRLTRPLAARADAARLDELLLKLQAVTARQFVADDPRADLDAFGLQTPDLEISLLRGTNRLATLQFGRSPTNDAALVYARAAGSPTVVTVAQEALAAWRGTPNDFRDRRLITLTTAPDLVEVAAEDNFTLRRDTNNTWRVGPEGFPADGLLVNDLLVTLGELKAVQFVGDAVTDADLPAYGLAPPRRQYTIRAAPRGADAALTNFVVAQLQLGTNDADQVYARRPDEPSSVYGLARTDVYRLPFRGLQLRERRLWRFKEADVLRLTWQQASNTTEFNHRGPGSWTVSPATNAAINELAVEETAHRLGELAAVFWVAHGTNYLAPHGFAAGGPQLTVELKSGEKLSVQFGAARPGRPPLGAVMLDGQPWIFEFPGPVYECLVSYLATRPNSP